MILDSNTESGTSSLFSVLVVDDDPRFTSELSLFLSSRYKLDIENDGDNAISRILELRPDVVLLDIDLGSGADGFEVLSRIRELDSPPQVLMLTGDRDTTNIVKAIKGGAYHYVCKPPVMSELVNLVNLAASATYTSRRVASLESDVHRLGGTFVVHDPAMKRVMDQIERVAPTDTTVLVVGETGTGKELVARCVHESSSRSTGPFVAVNCAAISESLLESELFGHVKHAFTGAARDRAGFFQQARGGTIFLDEIGHASEGLQVRLLRVLESREFMKVGGEIPEKTDVRVIAASSRDLREAATRGEFKEELLYRLGVYRIDLPPLRFRRGDIMPLAEYFLDIFSEQIGRNNLQFSPEATEYLLAHDWPGNVRRLRNCIERAVIDCRSDTIQRDQLAPSIRNWSAVLRKYDEARSQELQSFRRDYLLELMSRCGNNVTEAAKTAGLSRNGLYRMLKEESLDSRTRDDQ